MLRRISVLLAVFMLALFCRAVPASAGSLVVGTEKSFPPFVFEKDGELAGFEIDLVREIARELKMEPKFIDIAFDWLVPALIAGNIDMIAAGMDVTPEREKQIAFSSVYYNSADAVVVPVALEDIEDTGDLRGTAVAVQFGTVQDQLISRDKQIIPMRYQRSNDALRAVLKGEATAALLEESVAKEYLRTEEAFGETLKIAFTLQETGGMAFGFRKDSSLLRVSVDTVLAMMEEDGRLEGLRREWFVPVNQ